MLLKQSTRGHVLCNSGAKWDVLIRNWKLDKMAHTQNKAKGYGTRLIRLCCIWEWWATSLAETQQSEGKGDIYKGCHLSHSKTDIHKGCHLLQHLEVTAAEGFIPSCLSIPTQGKQIVRRVNAWSLYKDNDAFQNGISPQTKTSFQFPTVKQHYFHSMSTLKR